MIQPVAAYLKSFLAFRKSFCKSGKRSCGVSGADAVRKLYEKLRRRHAQKVQYVLSCKPVPAAYAKVQKRQTVSYGTVRASRKKRKGVLVRLNAYLSADAAEPGPYYALRNAAEIQAYAPGLYGCRKLVGIRGAEDEDRVLGRLFQWTSSII